MKGKIKMKRVCLTYFLLCVSGLFLCGCPVTDVLHKDLVQKPLAQEAVFDAPCKDVCKAIETVMPRDIGIPVKKSQGDYIEGGIYKGQSLEISYKALGKDQTKVYVRCNVIGDSTKQDAIIDAIRKELGLGKDKNKTEKKDEKKKD
jgi:hypothetical protein